MKKRQIEGFKYIEGGVCASIGFTAGGLNCGLNPNPEKNDFGMIYSEKDCNTGCVYTTNLVKGAPILVTKANLKKSGNISRAVIANSKNANTCNKDGEFIAGRMCELAGKALGIDPSTVIVASTGVIGQPLSVEPFEKHIDALVKDLSKDGHSRAEWAVMTTDTVPKEVAVEFEIEGKTCHLGGMAKGSGMIHPNMATTLNFITSDVCISSEMIQKALDKTVKVTYNCISVDRDTSTNDMVSVMANGLAGNSMITGEGSSYDKFESALLMVMESLAVMLASDGEGAGKLLTCKVIGAPSWECGITCAKSIICSNLFKCAMYGEDANWGRVLCAIGYSGADVDIQKIDVTFESEKGSLPVCQGGYGIPFSEEFAKEVFAEDEIEIHVNLNQGSCEATAWGCDMTLDYVRINGDYRS